MKEPIRSYAVLEKVTSLPMDPMVHPRVPLLLIALLLTAGCAHVQPTGSVRGLRPPVSFEPIRILDGTDPLTGLEAYDGDDLFALGYQAFDEGDHERAAALYERMLVEFPEHPDCTPATWNLALSHEKLGRLADAAAGLSAYAQLVVEADPTDAARARVRQAGLLQHAERWLESGEALASIPADSELPPEQVWEVEILAAMVDAAAGGHDDAEDELDRIRRDIKRTTRKLGERFPYQSAMVWYAAGQLYRMRASAVLLEQADDVAALDQDLGRKAGYLLEARQHLKRSLRHGVSAWSGPAAFALGAVYEDFRADLLAAPRPTGLSSEAGAVYDELLAERTRQFLEKAAVDYREVLSLSQLLRLEDAWIDVIQEALDRCEAELETGFTASAGPLHAPRPGGG